MNIDENEIKIRDQRQSVRLQSCPDRPQDRDNYKVIFINFILRRLYEERCMPN